MIEFAEVHKIDGVIDDILTKLSGVESTSDEYSKLIDQMTKLIKMKEIIANLEIKAFEADAKKDDLHNTFDLNERKFEAEQVKIANDWVHEEALIAIKRRESDKPHILSKDTMAIVAGNLAGIALILSYEKMNVIASKALSFVMKTR